MPTHRARAHTHTWKHPLIVSAYCFHTTQLQANETYLWQEHAAHALTHAGSPRAGSSPWPYNTITHTGIQSLQKKRGWWRDEDRTERLCHLLFPVSTLGSYLTLLCVSLLSAPCCDPAFLIPLLFYPAAKTSLFLKPQETLPLSISFSVFKSFSLKHQESLFFLLIYSPLHLPSLHPVLSPHAPFTQAVQPFVTFVVL